jgi:hypothetical protein
MFGCFSMANLKISWETNLFPDLSYFSLDEREKHMHFTFTAMNQK